MPVKGSREELSDSDRVLEWRLLTPDVAELRRRTLSKDEDDPFDLCRTLRLVVPGVAGVAGVGGSAKVLLDARLRLRFKEVKKPLFRVSWRELVGELPPGLELLISSTVSVWRDRAELCRFHFLGSIVVFWPQRQCVHKGRRVFRGVLEEQVHVHAQVVKKCRSRVLDCYDPRWSYTSVN